MVKIRAQMRGIGLVDTHQTLQSLCYGSEIPSWEFPAQCLLNLFHASAPSIVGINKSTPVRSAAYIMPIVGLGIYALGAELGCDDPKKFSAPGCAGAVVRIFARIRARSSAVIRSERRSWRQALKSKIGVWVVSLIWMYCNVY